ncbi:hypothetical protein T492DRAFT_167910 [Pavlovales sp. CCMP2436]|nr:hypothetical protein T492DRAFT_167910 [Pavlovales sp. CCMP2436]
MRASAQAGPDCVSSSAVSAPRQAAGVPVVLRSGLRAPLISAERHADLFSQLPPLSPADSAQGREADALFPQLVPMLFIQRAGGGALLSNQHLELAPAATAAPPEPPSPVGQTRGLRTGYLNKPTDPKLVEAGSLPATVAGAAATVAEAGANTNAGAPAQLAMSLSKKRPAELIAGDGASNSAPKVANHDGARNRVTTSTVCTHCERRLPLVASLTSRCKCGHLYCGAHLQPGDHQCNYDHKG